MISDVLAGINAGCRGSLLVGTGKGFTEAEAALKRGLSRPWPTCRPPPI